MTTVALQPGFYFPTRSGADLLWDELSKRERQIVDQLLKLPALRDKLQVLRMSGSDANYLSKKLGDLIFGATAFTAPANIYGGLWTAALTDTFNGATASEAAYTSYARLLLANNTTIFAAGSGTTTYVKQFPSDASKSFPTATGGSSTVTFIGFLDGNAGTSADNGIIWASLSTAVIGNGVTPTLAQNAMSQTRD